MSRRKTEQQLRLRGTYRADRHSRSHPTFEPGAKCPAYLSKEARAEWRRVAPDLTEQGLLTAASAQTLAAYCASFAHWVQSEAAIQRDGLVINIQSTTRTGQTIKPVPNPAVKNYQTFKRLMLEAAQRFGLDPLNAMRIEAPTLPPAKNDPDAEKWDVLTELLKDQPTHVNS